MAGVFVTATGTDVGKTFVSAALVRAARARGMSVRALKPVLSGTAGMDPAHTDAGILLAAAGRTPDPDRLDDVTPWRFSAPLSPDMAAQREGRTVPWDALVEFSRPAAQAGGTLPDFHLVEGVGGVMVPIDDRHTVLDWIAATGLPPVLVAGTYLGTLSHTLTALAVLAQAGSPAAAVILSESQAAPVSADETRSVLARFTDVPVLIVPRTDPAGAVAFVDSVLDLPAVRTAARHGEPPSS